ncbi:unnamed protein product [Heligmosomoides polygyrus]|uniref:Nkap_C domain-containing protein n=1 Tax=Heligmosomoides polygyrus TaxID=6339 RepID=A0A183FIX7_HELPZ|nr:unnamed protein product [Heligmosomoides polygyrus]
MTRRRRRRSAIGSRQSLGANDAITWRKPANPSAERFFPETPKPDKAGPSGDKKKKKKKSAEAEVEVDDEKQTDDADEQGDEAAPLEAAPGGGGGDQRMLRQLTEQDYLVGHVTSVMEPGKDGMLKEKAFIAGGTSQTEGLQQIQLCENDEKRLRIEAIKNEIRSETVSDCSAVGFVALPATRPGSPKCKSAPAAGVKCSLERS